VYLETTYQHLQGLDKDSRRKAKARTKDYKFVLKDNQGPRTKAKDNITANCYTRNYNTVTEAILHYYSLRYITLWN